MTPPAPPAPHPDNNSPEGAPTGSGPGSEHEIELHASAVVEHPWLGRIACADALFVTDERQRIREWSSAAQRMLGYSPEEAIGKPCYRVVMGREVDGHPVCGPNCPVTRNARRGRGTAAYEVVARTRDGSPRRVQNSVLVLDGPRGTFNVAHVVREVPGPVEPLSPSRERRPGVVPAPLAERLTRRELEVVRLTAEGLSVDEIAGQLSISTLTARNHAANAQHKLGARNRLDMVLQGMRRGLV